MKHLAQGFEQIPIVNVYGSEEEHLLQTVCSVRTSDGPVDSNVIDSHVIYKVKQDDEKVLAPKPSIAPHGTEDDMKGHLMNDFTTCVRTELRTLESIFSLKGWKDSRGDFKTASLKSGDTSSVVYVQPQRESKYRSTHLWLLLVEAYGLVNSNEKLHHISDMKLICMGLAQS